MLARARVLVVLLVLACGGHPPPASTTPTEASGPIDDAGPAPEPTPPPAAHVRLIHAAVESNTAAISLVADEDTTGSATTYQFSSADLVVTPGRHTISARANDAELIQAAFEFPEGPTTLVAYSTGDFPAALAMLPDATDPAPTGSSNVRFFHAIAGTAAVDVCAPPASGRGDGSPIVAGIHEGALGGSGYVVVPGGTELTLQLRAAHGTPCHGRVIGSTRFTPAAEANYTVVFVGRTSGRQRVAPELLFCADPPAADTSCATAPIAAH